MRLYDKDGWLDIPHIEEIADNNNISFIVIIGKRQVGKTYGVLKHMLDTDRQFVLLRGVKTEMDMLKKNVNSPFEKIKGYQGKIIFESETEYTVSINRLEQKKDEEGNEVEYKKPIGMLSALSCIGRIRGFNGDIYDDVVYDEFIPESHLLKVRNGEDAFDNMYTTIAGNRELEGRKPLRVWLLANSNNLDNDILKALNITEIVERMSLRGEESRILTDRGIMILLPDSTKITEKRKKTALFRAIGGDSKFSKMAFDNEFSYNEYTDVAIKPLKEYKAIISFPNCTVHLHKSDKTIYVTTLQKSKPLHTYTDGEYGKMTFAKDFPEIKAAYLKGRICFQSMAVKNYFLDIIDKL